MKKLNLIMPIASLGAVATGMGMTIGCSSDNAIHLTTIQTIEAEGMEKIIYSEVQTLEPGKYTAVIDMNNFWETDHRTSVGHESIFEIRNDVGETSPDPKYANFDNVQVWYDNTKLEGVDSEYDLASNKYYLNKREGALGSFLYIGKGTVKTGKEKVKIKFNLLEPVENYYLCFFGPQIK